MELGGSLHCTRTHRSERTAAVHLALPNPPYATLSIVGVQDLSHEQKCTIITSCFLTLIMSVINYYDSLCDVSTNFLLFFFLRHFHGRSNLWKKLSRFRLELISSTLSCCRSWLPVGLPFACINICESLADL